MIEAYRCRFWANSVFIRYFVLILRRGDIINYIDDKGVSPKQL